MASATQSPEADEPPSSGCPVGFLLRSLRSQERHRFLSPESVTSLVRDQNPACAADFMLDLRRHYCPATHDAGPTNAPLRPVDPTSNGETSLREPNAYLLSQLPFGEQGGHGDGCSSGSGSLRRSLVVRNTADCSRQNL